MKLILIFLTLLSLIKCSLNDLKRVEYILLFESQWNNNLKPFTEQFDNNQGIAQIQITPVSLTQQQKNEMKELYLNQGKLLDKQQKLKATDYEILLRFLDGNYRDSIFSNMIFSIQIDQIEKVKENDLIHYRLELENKSTSLNTFINYKKDYDASQIKELNLTLEFYLQEDIQQNNDLNQLDSLEHKFDMVQIDSIKLKIGDDNQIQFQEFTKQQIWKKISIFYTLALISGLIQLFYLKKLKAQIIERPEFMEKFSLFTILYITIWDDFILFYFSYNTLFLEDMLKPLGLILIFVYYQIWKKYDLSLFIKLFKNKVRGRGTVLLIEYIQLSLLTVVVIVVSAYMFLTQDWLILIGSSLFIPQIMHNFRVQIQFRFDKVFYEYIYGILLPHMILPLFLKLTDHQYNLMENQPNIYLSFMIIIYIFFQILTLHLQEQFGVRFFLPSSKYNKIIRGKKIEKYNYFQNDEQKSLLYNQNNQVNQLQNINNKDENQKLQQEQLQSSSQLSFKIQQQQCSICVHDLNESVTNNNLKLTKKIKKLIQSNHMITPCGHIFHSFCLIEWMFIKLQCPMCRQKIPSLI